MTTPVESFGIIIMLVDDDADGRFFAERSLKKAFPGSSIVVCKSANEAMLRLADTKPDAIVTDHQLGRLTGCEFISYVRQQGLTCPVVMVTCSENPQIAQAAMLAGATKVFRTDGDAFAEFLKQHLHMPDPSSPVRLNVSL